MEELSANPVLGQPSAGGMARQVPKGSTEPLMGRRFSVKTGSAGNPGTLEQMLQTGQASDQARLKANVVGTATLGIHPESEQHPIGLESHHVLSETKHDSAEQVEHVLPESMRPKASEERTGPEEANQLEEGDISQEGEINFDEFTGIYESESEAEPDSLEEAGVISQEPSREEEETPLREPKVEGGSRRSIKTSKQESRQESEVAKGESEVAKEETTIDEQSFGELLERIPSKDLIGQLEIFAEQFGLGKEIISTILLLAKDVEDRCGPSASKEEKTTVLAQRLNEEKVKLSPEAYKAVSMIVARHFAIDLGSLERMQEKLRNVEQNKVANKPPSQEQRVSGRKSSKPTDVESRDVREERLAKEDEEEREIKQEEQKQSDAAMLYKIQKAKQETDVSQKRVIKKQKRDKEKGKEIQKEERKDENRREDEIDSSS